MMVVRRFDTWATVLIGCLAMSCGSAAHRTESASCLESVFAEYTASQRAWQETLRNIIAADRPEFAELASISKELQLAMIDKVEARFRYVTASPERLAAQPGLSRFENLGVIWSRAYETALAGEDPEYRTLVQRADSLRALSDGNPDWPRLQAYATEELSQNPEFIQALEQFQRVQRDGNERLGVCRSEQAESTDLNADEDSQ